MLLRPWRDADVPAIAAACRDAEIVRFTSVPAEATEAVVGALLLAQEPLRKRGELLSFLRVRRADGAVVGPMSLHRVDLGQGTAQIGFWTAAALRGQGLTTGALRLLVAYALGPLGLARLELRADVENAPSRAVAERTGFRYEGTLRSVETRDGVRRDQAVYGLLRVDVEVPGAPSVGPGR